MEYVPFMHTDGRLDVATKKVVELANSWMRENSYREILSEQIVYSTEAGQQVTVILILRVG